jgi:hypothetical protein
MPVVASQGLLYSKSGPALLLPVERKSYIRQLGAAAALSQLQLWGGTSVVLLLWWLLNWRLLAGPQPFPLAVVAGVLAFSAAFQVAVFGVVAWTARYRSKALSGFVMAVLFPSSWLVLVRWVSSPGELPQEVMWIAGIMAVLGLLVTFDAYRRWLAADFD